jgi:hypothetical protein
MVNIGAPDCEQLGQLEPTERLLAIAEPDAEVRRRAED